MKKLIFILLLCAGCNEHVTSPEEWELIKLRAEVHGLREELKQMTDSVMMAVRIKGYEEGMKDATEIEDSARAREKRGIKQGATKRGRLMPYLQKFECIGCPYRYAVYTNTWSVSHDNETWIIPTEEYVQRYLKGYEWKVLPENDRCVK